MHNIQLEASELGVKLFRNQTGTYKLADGRYLTSGLCVGSSDLIGWKPLEITQEMVGKTFAQFTAVEVKSPKEKGKKAQPTVEQARFIDAIIGAGGMAFCTNDLAVAIKNLK